MSTVSAPTPAGNGTSPFGNAVARRWAPPGPRSRPRPAPLGTVGAAAVRFSVGLGQVPQVRRQLAGPKPIRAAGAAGTAGNVAPPRWWVPAPARTESSWGAGSSAGGVGASGGHAGGPGGGASDVGVDVGAVLAAGRQLRRAVGPAPTLESHRPGAASAAMTGKVIPVRRVPEVAFTGNMKGAASKLVPPRNNIPEPNGARVDSARAARSKAAGPPGPTAGDGGPHRPAAGAVPRSDALRFGAVSAARAGTVRRQRPTSSAAAVVVPGVRNRWSDAARAATAVAAATTAPTALRQAPGQLQPSAFETANVVRRAWSRLPASNPGPANSDSGRAPRTHSPTTSPSQTHSPDSLPGQPDAGFSDCRCSSATVTAR